jgi:hypothetical protein
MPQSDSPSNPTPKPDRTPGFEFLNLVPGDIELAIGQADESGCTDDQIADDVDRCNRLVSDLTDALADLSAQYRDLRQDAHLHELAVHAYETELGSFTRALNAFEADLKDYESQLAGRMYTTTALINEADALDQVRSALSAVRTLRLDSFDQLTQAGQELRGRKSDLGDAIQKLIDRYSKSLRDFVCQDCSGLRPLIEQLRNLLRRVGSVRASDPSAAPGDIPWVPTLPPPPWSGTQGVPGSAAAGSASSIRVLSTGTPTPTGIPPVISAGQIFPNRIPVEGAPRLCVGQVWWLYRMKMTGSVLQQVFEGTRGPTFQFLFQREPAPKVEVEGGLDVSDVVVSEDRTRVYFTLYREGSVSAVREANVTITDASGTVIRLHSSQPDDDPSPILRFDDGIAYGLAGLLTSLGMVAVDSFFEKLRADSKVQMGDFSAEMSERTETFRRIAHRMIDRAGDDIREWHKDHIDEILDVLPVRGEVMPSGGAIGHSLAPVPAFYEVHRLCRVSGSRGFTGAFEDHANMVLDRLEQWGASL